MRTLCPGLYTQLLRTEISNVAQATLSVTYESTIDKINVNVSFTKTAKQYY